MGKPGQGRRSEVEEDVRRDVVKYRKAGYSWPEIAEELELEAPYVAMDIFEQWETWQLAEENRQASKVENILPQRAIQAVAKKPAGPKPVSGDPVEALADELGLPVEKVRAIKAAFESRPDLLNPDVQTRVSAKDLHATHAKLAAKYGKISLEMDDDLIKSRAYNNPHRLAIAMATHTEKMRLLEGQATEIVEVRDRRGLDELTDLLLDMQKKRGMAEAKQEIEVEGEVVS